MLVSPLAFSETLQDRYPILARGFLESAVLEPLNDGAVLIAGDIVITQIELDHLIKAYDPDTRLQLEKAPIVLLEREFKERILVNEAIKQGFSTEGKNKNNERLIAALIQKTKNEATVTESEIRSFYENNKSNYPDKPYDAMESAIRTYLLSENRRRAKADFFDRLCTRSQIRLDSEWIKSTSSSTLDNPVDKARLSGKPSLVDFGSIGCASCDMMQPILEDLRKSYSDRLNVVFIHIRNYKILAQRYGINSIPVQILFDEKGNEIFRHDGAWPKSEIIGRLQEIGIPD